jgi:glycosyltransferase involved in cell wall biosynthesis
MKVVHLIPGSGGTFYCENCLRDNALVPALRAQGVDAILMPMYLPLMQEAETAAPPDGPVFYGAVNLYLAQRLPAFIRLPSALRRLLDSPPVLRWAARRAGSTSARGLEDMTLSMLSGEKGRQAEALETLVRWLVDVERPDIVHLSSALLLGLARRIRQALHVPVVCTLQDEDGWVDAMPAPYAARVWNLMAERAVDVDAFMAVSWSFAERMRLKLCLPENKLHTVRIGMDLRGYEPADRSPAVPTVGYLSRLCEAQGLDILIDAFIRLRADPAFSTLRLAATGGRTPADRRFLAAIDRRIRRAGLSGAVCIESGFAREDRIRFLRGLTLLSVPVRGGEAFGTFQIEALACGVPVVQPDEGGFREIAAATGGGTVYSPNAPGPLAAALAELLRDEPRRRRMAERGRAAVLAEFGIERMAERVGALYRALSDARRGTVESSMKERRS